MPLHTENTEEGYQDYYDFNVTARNVEKSALWEWDDATWILAASFIIFTMQTGFGMLEAGIVSLKNQVNIMMKNVVDVVLGGLTYWAFGYGLSYGRSAYSNAFVSFGDWFVDADEDEDMGPTFTRFLFQLSFATTATTIVSGAMAERCNFNAYCLFSLVNTIVYCLPAHWLWSPKGILYNMGVVDIAGSGGVHLTGGTSAFVAATMLGPRLGRWDLESAPPMGSPTYALIGLFMLWWGWLAFNSGSTFGVTGNKWRLAAKATCTTMTSSFGGGLVSLIWSHLYSQGHTIDVLCTINGVLGALVGVTAGCAVVNVWEAVIIGAIGALLANVTEPLLIRVGIDDAVGATCVHGFGGAWGMIAVGIFAAKDTLEGYCKFDGLLHGGGFYLLGVQLAAVAMLIAWSAVSTFTLLFVINRVVPIRMSPEEELLGADFSEHEVKHDGVGVSRAASVLGQFDEDIDDLKPRNRNIGHEIFIADFYAENELNI